MNFTLTSFRDSLRREAAGKRENAKLREKHLKQEKDCQYDGWKCRGCGLVNSKTALVCTICDAYTVRSSYWNCRTCSYWHLTDAPPSIEYVLGYCVLCNEETEAALVRRDRLDAFVGSADDDFKFACHHHSVALAKESLERGAIAHGFPVHDAARYGRREEMLRFLLTIVGDERRDELGNLAIDYYDTLTADMYAILRDWHSQDKFKFFRKQQLLFLKGFRDESSPLYTATQACSTIWAPKTLLGAIFAYAMPHRHYFSDAFNRKRKYISAIKQSE